MFKLVLLSALMLSAGLAHALDLSQATLADKTKSSITLDNVGKTTSQEPLSAKFTWNPKKQALQLTELFTTKAIAIGTWNLRYSWDCTGTYSSTPIHIHSNGTFTQTAEGPYSGTWKVTDTTYTHVYSSGLGVTYTGKIESRTKIVGTMNAPSGNGCFEMVMGQSLENDFIQNRDSAAN